MHQNFNQLSEKFITFESWLHCNQVTVLEKIETVTLTKSPRYETGELKINGQLTDKYFWKKTGSPVLHICTFAETLDVIIKRDVKS